MVIRPDERRSREKAIANRAERAHDECVHNYSTGVELFAKDSRA
jgi:hypothetical protein